MIAEILKTRAAIITFVEMTLTTEQLNVFNETYKDTLKKLMKEFVEDYPSLIEGGDEIKNL